MENFCLDCNTLLRGRVDKKFCDDQCRSNYNNKLKGKDQAVVKEIDQILKRNRKILASKNPTGKTKVKRSALTDKGFNFNYHTHTYETQKGTIYIFCYEYGYLLLENEDVLLVKREEK